MLALRFSFLHLTSSLASAQNYHKTLHNFTGWFKNDSWGHLIHKNMAYW